MTKSMVRLGIVGVAHSFQAFTLKATEHGHVVQVKERGVVVVQHVQYAHAAIFHVAQEGVEARNDKNRYAVGHKGECVFVS